MTQRSFGPELRAECRQIAESYGSTLSDVIRRTKDPVHVLARREVARNLRRQGKSLHCIGELLGGRNHSVIFSLVTRDGREVSSGRQHLADLEREVVRLRLRVEALEAAVERLTAR